MIYPVIYLLSGYCVLSVFFFKQKTAYEMRISDWSSDVCSSDLAWQYDEPIADSSMLPTYLLARAVRPFATVALGGDGGDELFGGYRHYSWLQRLERWHGCMPLWLRRAIAGGAEHWLPVGPRGRTYMAGIGGPVERLLSHVDLHFEDRSEEHTSELQSLMRISYAV